MKILIINIRYGYVGGPERYLFNLKNLLENHRHSVIPFSINYALNEPTPYREYFVSPLASEESVYYKNQDWSFKTVAKTLERNFYSDEVETRLTRLIEDTRPDFAIVLLYLRKLSPSVLVALTKMKIPFAVRLSDYGMICPSNNFFRGDQICELCLHGDIINSVRYKCVHNSYGASIVNYFATKYHWSKNYFSLIKHFISPSKFLISKMIEAGWDERKFHHLPTFANVPESTINLDRRDQILYAGRIEKIKGVHVLLEAVTILRNIYGKRCNVILAGNGDEEYINALKQYCVANGLVDVEFVGDLRKNELFSLYEQSLFSIIPSLWYDNLPNAALESLAVGTPVVAPKHGCFTDLINDGENGLLFDPGNAESLCEKMNVLLENPDLLIAMRHHSVKSIRDNYSAEMHYEKLMNLIHAIVKNFSTNFKEMT